MSTYDVKDADYEALLDIVRALGLTPEDIAAGSMTVDPAERTITVDEIVRDEHGQMLVADDEAMKVRRTYQIDHRARLITEEKP